MLRTIDRINGFVVQKITKPDGKVLRYQTMPENEIGKGVAVSHDRLGAARDWCRMIQMQPAE